ncbi:MAG: diheme cytochrome c-553 [Segetibacter sp.]
MQFFSTPLSKTIFFLIVLFLFIASCSTNNSKDDKKEDINHIRALEGEELVSRGKYLVTGVGGCGDCHSPKNFTAQGPVEDTTRLLSGTPANIPVKNFDASALKPGNFLASKPDLTAFVGPWGISFPANLTPDSATGIGAWTGDVFIKTIRTGKHLGQDDGRPILPPMPWSDYAKLTDEDLQAIYSYLRSIPPVSNKVPAPISPDEAMKLAKKS